MRAGVLRPRGQFALEEKYIPQAGPGEAVVQVRLTTICETDLEMVKRVNGKSPVPADLTLGHEATGIIHDLGPGVTGCERGQRVLVGSNIEGTQAEFVLIPDAHENLASIPRELSDEQVLLLAHVASTGFAAVEQAEIKLGDTVAVFSRGPVGLCTVLGARLRGAADIIVVDADPMRLAIARQYGATILRQHAEDLAIETISDGRGVDVAFVDTPPVESIEGTFESALCALRPGGALLSVSVACGHLKVDSDAGGAAGRAASGAGRQEYAIANTLCPGTRNRMERLLSLVRAQRIDLSPLVTHLFTLNEIVEAYELFESRRNGVLKVGIRVS